MSLLKVYTTLVFSPLIFSAVTLPYRAYKYFNTKKDNGEWNPQDYLQTFSNLSQVKNPTELPARIAPLHLSKSRPYIHQGVLGVDSQQEADERIGILTETLSLGAGVVCASIPIVSFFNRCLESTDLGVCAQTTGQDLITYAGLPLLAGAYLISHFVKAFFIGPVLLNVSQNSLDNHLVFKQLSDEYKKMLTALNLILDKPADDPKFIETAKLAKQFLRLSPEIEQELHNSLALDRAQAKELLLPIRVACRQFLIKASLNPIPLPAPVAAPSLEEVKTPPVAAPSIPTESKPILTPA